MPWDKSMCDEFREQLGIWCKNWNYWFEWRVAGGKLKLEQLEPKWSVGSWRASVLETSLRTLFFILRWEVMKKFEGEECHDLTHVLKASLLLLCEKDSLGSRDRNTEASQEAVAIITVGLEWLQWNSENELDNEKNGSNICW